MPEFFYRLLGWVASINDSASRFRFNGMPSNILIFVVPLFMAAAGFSGVTEAVNCRSGPQRKGVRDVSPSWTWKRYVTVSGTLIPALQVERVRRTESGGELSRGSLHVLVEDREPAAKRPASTPRSALLVDLKDAPAADAAPRKVSITGMLRAVRGSEAESLEQLDEETEELSLNTAVLLREGDVPANPWGSFVLGLIGGAGLLPLTACMLLKNVIFRPCPVTQDAALWTNGHWNVEVRATGEMVLDGKHRRRFLDVPSGLQVMPSGELAIYSNVDASNQVYGITLQRREGTWWTLARREGFEEPVPGQMYLGRETRPALRLQFLEAVPNRPDPMTVVLSFANEVERALVLEVLEEFRGSAV